MGCGCSGGDEGADKQVWRLLGVEADDERVTKAEKDRRQFVRESELKFPLVEKPDEEEEEEATVNEDDW